MKYKLLDNFDDSFEVLIVKDVTLKTINDFNNSIDLVYSDSNVDNSSIDYFIYERVRDYMIDIIYNSRLNKRHLLKLIEKDYKYDNIFNTFNDFYEMACDNLAEEFIKTRDKYAKITERSVMSFIANYLK